MYVSMRYMRKTRMPEKIFDLFDIGKDSKFNSKPLAHLHTYYLSGEIKEPEHYIDIFDSIRSASETDIIRIHINSSGGHLFTAIQFMRVMRESQAQIICSVEGACMSAATMIFLSGSSFEISEHSMFMFHNYSSIVIGKGGEMYDNIVHERKWSERILRQVYKNFLTEDEIKSILDNKDIWMEGEEVIRRLKKVKEKEIEKLVKPSKKPTKKPAKKPTKQTKNAQT